MNARHHARTPSLLLALTLGMAGCASTSPGYDSRFGDAARALKAQQTLDVTAGQRNREAALQADGRTVRAAMERQNEEFRTPTASNVQNSGVGIR